MPIFEVTTHSVFENKFFIEADNAAEAAIQAENGKDDFFQKHLQEKAVNTVLVEISGEQWADQKREEGYF